MANTIFAYDNLAVGSTVAVTTAETGYPASRLTDYYAWNRCWLDAGTGNIVVDLGSAKDIKCMGLVHTNLTSGVTIGIQGNASDSWGAPSYDSTITYKDRNQVKVLSSAETYRYWRFVFSGGSLSNVKIGQIFLGDYLELGRTFKADFARQLQRPQISQSTAWGVSRTYTVAGKVAQWNLPYTPTRADLESLETMWDTLEAGAKPCIFIPDTGDTADQTAYYCKMGPAMQEQFRGGAAYNLGDITIQMVEEPPVLET